ncbi:hypothetical protein HanHA300_Chr16g0613041 [Helianthus annuus]|nr:hypothetical protein HanHA300_Chr16g0613041 [Helianthus annuus]KAJ0460683.1 hypothetical protein HanHA89_Chr16g0663641 [Helianthus annuus]
MASNRSPSPLSSRNCRNSESNSTTRKSFSGNPFPRPTNLTNPKSSNPYTPSNTPTASDLAKRNSIVRKSIGGGSMFQDGKENRKDAFRSPAKVSTKNFMSPTISATSKVTPSPRKKILGEKNEVTRASFEFLGKESDLTSETPNFDQTVKMNEESDVSKIEHIVEQKEVVQNVSVDEVHLGLISDESDLVKIRPFCCSPMTSPVIAANADPQLPPYDPKKNFLSPRPQYLRYKPNPQIDEQSEVVNEETERIEEPINEQIQSDVNEVEEKSLNLGEVEETKSEVVTLEAESERVQNEVEIEPSVAVSNDESEASSLFSTQSIATISVAGVSMVILAVLAVFYMIQKKSSASKSAAIGVNIDENMPEESGSSESINVQKGNKKKKSNNKRESLASSTSQFSVSDSFGSFTTFERIAIKHKDEVMLTPIRRSSRLLKSQGISS